MGRSGVPVEVTIGVAAGVAVGAAVGVAIGVELGTAIVIPTVSQRLLAKVTTSSVSSDEFIHCKKETYSLNLLDCMHSRRLGGACL